MRTGNVALLGSRWRLAGTTAEGRAIALSGQGAEVVRRQADGSWRYVVEPQAASGLLH